MNSKLKTRSSIAAVMMAVGLMGSSVAPPLLAQPGGSGFERFTILPPSVSVGQSATLLPSGQWLILGGEGGQPSGRMLLAANAGQAQVSALPTTLAYPRTGQTATVLPDGKVFIVGGKGVDGRMVTVAELYDPVARTLQSIPDTGLFPRSHHTATLLTDGHVLIAGGLSADGKPIQLSELWNPETRKAMPVVAALNEPRSDQQAALLANGKGLLWGGKDGNGLPVAKGELYDPVKSGFSNVPWWDTRSLPSSALDTAGPVLEASIPGADATGVAVDARVAFRFSKRLDISSINTSTVTLVGPAGAVNGRVVGAEAGMLGFFNPSIELLPDTTYTLFINGAVDTGGRSIPFTTFSFTTQRIPSNGKSGSGSSAGSGASGAGVGGQAAGYGQSGHGPSQGGVAGSNGNSDNEASANAGGYEDWIPQEENRHGAWRVLGLRQDPVLQTTAVALPSAPNGVTAIAGRVLRLNGLPLSGVAVSASGQSVTTDPNGVFLLQGVPAGQLQLKVDGTAVVQGGRHYTSHFIDVASAAGKTSPISSPIYLPRVDPATEVSIASPADRELVLTHPAMPGLEVHIPKGAVLREYDGKIVTKLSITPIPVDRAPYPAPVPFSTYFTLQPGGAYVDGDPSKAVRIVYPNYQGLSPGSSVHFWNYDPTGKGWKVYGKGTVSRDGKQVLPNPGVGFRQIMTFGFGVSPGTPAPPTGPSCPSCNGGDPVDMSTGLFTHEVTEISLSDVIPIQLTHNYHQNDPNFHEFGLGTTLSYAMFIDAPPTSGGVPPIVNLVLANGTRIPFTLQTGSGLGSAVWMNTSPTEYQGAVLTADASYELFYLKMRGGTTLTFGTHHGTGYNQLQNITDANGNIVTITIAGSSAYYPGQSAGGVIQRITSPNGRYIQLTYDHGNNTPCVDASGASRSVITQATDNLGRSATFDYDSACRLWHAYDLDNHYETYNYDSQNRMTSVIDKNGQQMVSNDSFDSGNRVTHQTLADKSTWQFTYTMDSSNSYVAQTTTVDPNNYTSVYTFDQNGQTTNIVLAQGAAEQQTYQIQRDSYSRMIQVTDTYNRVTHYDYSDPYGGPTGITYMYGSTNPAPLTYTLTYDPVFHNLSSVKDPMGHLSQVTYTAQGNPYQYIDALGYATTLGYSGNGQGLPTSVTDANNHVWNLSYAGADLASVTDPNSNTTQYFTDAIGRLLTVTDPLGRTQQLQYDNMDRVQQSIDAMGGITIIGHDNNGNVTGVTDPRQAALGTQGKSHGYTPDSRNRTHIYTDPLGKTVSYGYDGLNHLTSVLDRNGNTTSTQFDGLGRPKLITFQKGSTITINWLDSKNQVQFVDSVNGTITFTYDNFFRITSEAGPGYEVDYTYDGANRRITMTVKGQTQVKYYYYDNNWLEKVVQGSRSVQLKYDNAGRPKTITLPNSVVATYTFDNANRLKSIVYKKGTTTLGDINYDGYDKADQVTSISGSLASLGQPSSPSASNVYDAANRLTSWAGMQPTFDDEGNMKTAFGNSFTWNDRNQLSAVNGNPVSYDALGRRVAYSTGSASHSTVYDGANPVLLDGATFMLAGGGLDQWAAKITSAGAADMLTDGLGSTLGLSSTTGSSLSTTYKYDPYGGSSESGSDSTLLQFSGRENDSNGGLYYYRNRYYSPQIGRFVSQDPIGLAGGANVYAYVGGNPIMRRDPSGRFAIIDNLATGAAGAVIGGAAGVINGLISGDSGSQLWNDLGAGALTGGLAGLTDGGSLLWTAPTNAAVASLIEFGREDWNYGDTDRNDILTAGLLGSLGTQAGTVSDIFAEGYGYLTGGIVGALFQMPFSYLDRLKDQLKENNKYLPCPGGSER